MTTSASIRVPREDGAVLVRPALDEARRWLAEPRGSVPDVTIGGLPFDELRALARREVVDAAVRETGELLRESIEPPLFETIVATGHQPEPFHPGVWIKNFAVDSLARGVVGVGLNVVVDNDLHTSSAVRVPAGDRLHPRIEAVPFDAVQPPGPWEEARLLDRDMWQSFPNRLRAALRPWGFDPVVRSYWGEAAESLAVATTGVRVRAERAAGLRNLEVSLSRVCETDAFRRFALHLLRDAERFHTIHEDVLADHRRRHRIRNRTHPVASLELRDGWIETPFRVWAAGERTRRPVLVRNRNDWLRLSDGEDEFAVLPADDDAELAALADRGLRFRTRALTTTMFLRLFVADLFVHGIGGAKYDELTDAITGRFLGIDPPPFLLLSATRHLPLGGPHPVTQADVRRVRNELRDLRYNGDRHAPTTPDVERLIAEKRSLIEEQQAAKSGGSRRERRARTPANRRRFERLQAVNAALADHAREHRAASLEQELADARRTVEANAILTNREWPWWLYPAESLPPWFGDVLPSR